MLMSWKEILHNIFMSSPLGQLYRYFCPIRRIYWDIQTGDLIKRWRTGLKGGSDYPIFRAYLEKFKPKRLLDIGCGSGRLFPLYAELMIPEVVGIDISPAAISKVEMRPNYTARVLEVERLDFPPNYFDAAISNAVLRHIPPGSPIARATSNIAEQCKSVLLREVIRGREFSYDFRHNYEALFRGKMHLVEHYQDEVADVFVFVK